MHTYVNVQPRISSDSTFVGENTQLTTTRLAYSNIIWGIVTKKINSCALGYSKRKE